MAYVETAPAVVDEVLEATPVELSHMEEYADYFADLEGGSAIGRSAEPEPFDVNRIGEDASRIRTSDAISAAGAHADYLGRLPGDKPDGNLQANQGQDDDFKRGPAALRSVQRGSYPDAESRPRPHH